MPSPRDEGWPAHAGQKPFDVRPQPCRFIMVILPARNENVCRETGFELTGAYHFVVREADNPDETPPAAVPVGSHATTIA